MSLLASLPFDHSWKQDTGINEPSPWVSVAPVVLPQQDDWTRPAEEYYLEN